MQPKTIGIIGGAGPLAGVFFLEQLVKLSSTLYGCHRDKDFPKIILISFPFSEMLTPEIDESRLKKELSECLMQLRRNGASILAIACNTLHAFLDENTDLSDLIHLLKIVKNKIPTKEPPLVLCTSTSVRFGIHQRFFSCVYPDIQTQIQVDKIIDLILQEADSIVVLPLLLELLEKQKEKTVVLGCTELSLFTHQLSCSGKLIIDPLRIAVATILEKSFSGK